MEKNMEVYAQLKPSKSRLLFISIWVVAVGIVLAVVGSVIGNTWARYTLMNDAGFVMLWAGIGILIFGAFGIAASGMQTQLKKEKQPINSRLLFAGIWIVAVGVSLAVVGSVVGNTWARYTLMNDAGFVMLWAGVGISVFGLFGVATGIIKMRLEKKKEELVLEKPLRLRIECEPAEIIADGVSRSMLLLRVVDMEGKPIAVSTDTQVRMCTKSGTLQNPIVTIPKGKSSETTVIVSSRESGPVLVSGEAEGLENFAVTLNFIEKRRYCMHCGALFPSKAKSCLNCGKMPPAGIDTKVCHNCKSVIPIVAKFCSECGGGQMDLRQV